jgi:hypothetical protein
MVAMVMLMSLLRLRQTPGGWPSAYKNYMAAAFTRNRVFGQGRLRRWAWVGELKLH